MIKKLRQKFILISMFSLTFVIAIIIGIINIHNYSSIVKRADEKLELIINNNGIFPREKDNKIMPPDNKMSPEAPFETRYFSVTLNNNGEVIKVNIDRIAAIDELSAESYATSLYNNSKTKGFFKNYRYQSKTRDTETLYVFIDCQHDLITFREFLYASLLFSLIGITTIFLLVFFSSKIILKPISESYEKQKHFITDASHELKTPLTVIDASADVLEMEVGENEWITSIKDQVTRLTKLTEDLLMLSRMNETNRVIFTDFSLSEVLEDSIKRFESVAISQGKTIETNIPNNISYNGEINMISQLFSILLDNALKYTNEKGLIKVSLSETEKNKKIVFYNTCENIEIGNHDYLLERFYRKDSSRNSNTGGHGIGLSIAKSIIDNHKGKINIKSDDGKSITITITLP
ncbi:MAG: HAMP domain-containing sensor histidine kinase [Bacilli bacterium]|nr:HAMP domain-containing sensor histidine kinase [Bacilli bacterium]